MSYLRNHDVRFAPLEVPGKIAARDRKRSQFKAHFNATKQLLDDELRHLKAQNVVLQVCVPASMIRNDGGLRAGCEPHYPPVVLSFNSKHGPVSMPSDTYDDWHDNVRAIALALQALRAIDRYGVTSRAEQYRGWQALPAPAPNRSEIITPEQALDFLAKYLGSPVSSVSSPAIITRSAIRLAQKKSHPDAGGNPDDFKRIMDCERVLREAGRV